VTVCPAAVTLVGAADLATVNPGAAAAVKDTVEGGEVVVAPAGVLPDAVAVFDTDPASISAWVTVYVAVQVTVAFGASDAAPAGQVTADNVPVPVNAPSFTVTVCIVTFPVFFTAKLYVTLCPAADTDTGNTDLVTVNAGLAVAVRTTVDGGELVVTPAGVLPDAVAVFDTDPASRLAWVTVYVAVHVTLAAGAIDAAPAGHDTADNDPDPENAPSTTVTPCTVTFPVFFTTKLYVTP
jgi:hypothetical protein